MCIACGKTFSSVPRSRLNIKVTFFKNRGHLCFTDTPCLFSFSGSSDLLSPIFNRKEKTEEVRKPMSLSERLRQEFGVDDDIDAELNTDTKTGAS